MSRDDKYDKYGYVRGRPKSRPREWREVDDWDERQQRGGDDPDDEPMEGSAAVARGDAEVAAATASRTAGSLNARAFDPHERPLWDLPTRLFHWTLVCLVPLAWASAEFQYYEVHQWTGYAVLALVLFRVVWGFAGSRHSRFIDFLVGPRRLWAYIRRRAPAGPGHNPLGGWSVVALLTVLLLQAVSGLFNTDDIFYTGPFYYAVGKGVRAFMGEVHDWGFNVLLVLVGLHIAAIGFYQFLRRVRLIQAMWYGRAPGREGRAPAISGWLALGILLAAIVLLALLHSLAPEPPSLMEEYY